MRKAGRLLSVAAAAVLAAVVGSRLPVHAQPDPLTAMTGVPATPPAAAPDVAFQASDGRRVGLAAFRGRPVLLTFFTTW
jgi:cytochrome oxidase Cu insertion factor (SCO1/SenC/PrrC family)